MSCAHHWLLETPDGPVTHGICKLCGEIKAFPTTVDDTYNPKTGKRGTGLQLATDPRKVKELRGRRAAVMRGRRR